MVGPVEVYLPLAGLIDPDEERARLEKDLPETESHIDRLEILLASPFAQKAPPQVVQNERDKLSSFIGTAQKIITQLENL